MKRPRILVDGDGCPVIDITVEVARQHNCSLVIFTNYSHRVEVDYGEVKKVDVTAQAVDMKIANATGEGDIVITQDYGLAALVLGRGAVVLNNSGSRFTQDNIDDLLAKRHHYAKLRRAGRRHPNQRKRSVTEDEKFKLALKQAIAAEK
ncbi:MAG: YaiI/YqxD family protein [Bacillota bacterium]